MSKSQNKRHHFAIIGGGIAGLSAAITIRRSGHEVTIFEKFSEAKAVGAGILLQPAGLQALQSLGLYDQLLPLVSRIDRMQGNTLKGRQMMDVCYADQWPDAFSFGVHRGNLFTLLYQTAIDAGIKICCDADIVSIERRDNTRLLQDQSGEIYNDFSAVIIANGSKSGLRQYMPTKHSAKPYPWGALWAIVDDDEWEYQNILMQRYNRASTMIGVLPSGVNPLTKKSCYSLFWSLPVDSYQQWQLQPLSEWKQEVLACWPELEGLLSKLGCHQDLLLASYSDVVMKRWHHQDMLCIGDAAHGMSPQLGQGANMAMIDSVILGQCIERHSDIATAFAAYSAARKSHLRFYHNSSKFLTPIFQSHSRVVPVLRDLLMPLVQKVPFIYREAVRATSGTKTGIIFDKDIKLTLPADSKS